MKCVARIRLVNSPEIKKNGMNRLVVTFFPSATSRFYASSLVVVTTATRKASTAQGADDIFNSSTEFTKQHGCLAATKRDGHEKNQGHSQATRSSQKPR